MLHDAGLLQLLFIFPAPENITMKGAPVFKVERV
jgi:hypothetical protein